MEGYRVDSEEEATLSREEKETVAEQLYNDWRAGKIKATDVDEVL